MKYCLTLFACFLLTGCANQAYRELSSASDQQLTMTTDTKLCQALDSDGAEPAQSYRFKQEAMRRNLTDCSPVGLYCNRQLGLKMGTPAYTKCGIKVAEMQAAKEAEERRIENENRQRALDRQAWLNAHQQQPMIAVTGPMNSNPVPVHIHHERMGTMTSTTSSMNSDPTPVATMTGTTGPMNSNPTPVNSDPTPVNATQQDSQMQAQMMQMGQ